MSIEKTMLVRVALTSDDHRQLVGDIVAARERAAEAPPGDRIDVIRYEALSTQLEDHARHVWLSGRSEHLDLGTRGGAGASFYSTRNAQDLPDGANEAYRWIGAGDIAVEVRLPFVPGVTPTPSLTAVSSAVPQEVWRATDSRGRPIGGAKAVAARFSEQVAAALRGEPDAAIMPTGIANRVLTETMRDYALAVAGVRPVKVPVRYQDGSYGPPFPLRSVPFGTEVPDGWDHYHFTMLSIRHTEVDSQVDGAWLRNVEISQNRQHGNTDRIAYEQSLEQFGLLTADRPVIVYIYQTGLQPAVMGIYRAAAEFLVSRPGMLAVVPRYFRKSEEAAEARTIAGYRQQSVFEESRRPWVT